MTSSYAAQQHGSRNPHQNPVKSHKGGYLRCPFNISASYAELAEKRVKDDLARGGATARAGAAVADKDGLLMSSSSAGRLSNNEDGLDGNEGRPWSRAGVGANKLSSKEKRTQQEQAELIYGRGSLANGDDATGASASATLGHGPSQENMFAVDTREQAALQQVVPRAVREKVKRRKFEELKQGRQQLGQHTPHYRGGKSSGGEGEGEVEKTERHRGSERGEHDDEGEALTKAAATEATSTTMVHNAKTSTPQNNTPQDRSPRQSPAVSPSAQHKQQQEQLTNPQRVLAKPKNRMQMLDDLRASALMGKKRRR